MSGQPAPSDDLDAGIEAALSELNISITEAKHHNDPLWMPLSALSAFLRVMRRLYADFAVSMRKSIEEAKQPVRDEDMRRAVVQGISAHAGAMVKSLSWSIRLAAVGILLLVGGGSFWLGQSTEAAKYVQVPEQLGVTLTGPDAAQWLDLIRNNNIRGAMAQCTVRIQASRKACDLPLWLESAPQP